MSFLEKVVPSVVTDDVKERSLTILFSNCPEMKEIKDQGSLGEALGFLLFYGIYLGTMVKESEQGPSVEDKKVLEQMFPEVKDAVKHLKIN